MASSLCDVEDLTCTRGRRSPGEHHTNVTDRLEEEEALLKTMEEGRASLKASYESAKMNSSLLRKRVQTLDKARAQSESEKISSEHEREQLEREMTSLREEVIEKGTSLEFLSTEMQKVNARIDVQSKDLKASMENNTELDKEKSDLQQISSRNAAEITRLKKEIQELQASIISIGESRAAGNEESARAQNEYTEALRRKDESLAAAEAQRGRWRDNLEKTSRAAQDWQMKNNELENTMAELKLTTDTALKEKPRRRQIPKRIGNVSFGSKRKLTNANDIRLIWRTTVSFGLRQSSLTSERRLRI